MRSDKDGSCNWCKTRKWKVGHKVYVFKKSDGKWAACTDRKCYLEQGGKLTISKNPLTGTVEAALPAISFVTVDLIFSDVDELRIRFEGSNTDYLIDIEKIEALFSMIAARKETIK